MLVCGQHCPGEGNEVHEDKGKGCWYLTEMEAKCFSHLGFSEEVLLSKVISIGFAKMMNRLVTEDSI